mgnify:CR=1 FL=1
MEYALLILLVALIGWWVFMQGRMYQMKAENKRRSEEHRFEMAVMQEARRRRGGGGAK